MTERFFGTEDVPSTTAGRIRLYGAELKEVTPSGFNPAFFAAFGGVNPNDGSTFHPQLYDWIDDDGDISLGLPPVATEFAHWTEDEAAASHGIIIDQDGTYRIDIAYSLSLSIPNANWYQALSVFGVDFAFDSTVNFGPPLMQTVDGMNFGQRPRSVFSPTTGLNLKGFETFIGLPTANVTQSDCVFFSALATQHLRLGMFCKGQSSSVSTSFRANMSITQISKSILIPET